MKSTETITAEQLAQRLERIAATLRKFPPPGVIRRPDIDIEWFSYSTDNEGPSRDQVINWAARFFGPTQDNKKLNWIVSDTGDGTALAVFVRIPDEEETK